eukprot:12181259-Karenia_brevis.AAC.1
MVTTREPGKSRATNHKPVIVRFREAKREPPNEARRKLRSLPDWLFKDDDFLQHWQECVEAWMQTRAHGLQGLHQFMELTQHAGRDWLRDHIIEAKTDHHRFEICMTAHKNAASGNPVSIAKVSRWFRIYPALRDMLTLTVDMVNSAVTNGCTNNNKKYQIACT